jgi:hypothetical protein
MKLSIKDVRSFPTDKLQWCISQSCKVKFTDATLLRIQAELDRRDGQGSDAA